MIIVLGRLQELLTMIKLPEQASCNIIFLLQIDDNLNSILKAELSAEMEKTERDLKRELSTDFLR